MESTYVHKCFLSIKEFHIYIFLIYVFFLTTDSYSLLQSGQLLYACSSTLFLGLSFAVIIEIFSDVRKMNNQAVTAKHSGMIILGGGLVKHHVNNANLMVREKCVKKLLSLYIIHSRYNQNYMFLLLSAYLNMRGICKGLLVFREMELISL